MFFYQYILIPCLCALTTATADYESRLAVWQEGQERAVRAGGRA